MEDKDKTTIEPSKEEFENLILKIKANKVVGADDIQGEMFKYIGEKLKQIVYQLLIRIWKEEEMTSKW